MFHVLSDGYFYSCRNCSNGKTSSGLLLDNPAFLHCDCHAGNNNWPTAVIDMSKSGSHDPVILAVLRHAAVLEMRRVLLGCVG